MSPKPSASASSDAPKRIRDYFGRYRVSFSAGIVFLIATQGLALSVPQFLRRATDALVASDWTFARDSALWLGLVAIIGSFTRIASRIFIFYSGRRVEYDIRNDLFDKLERLQPSFYQKLPSGQIMSRAVNDLTQVRLLLGPGILNITNTGLVYIVVVPLLFLKDPVLAAATLAALPALIMSGKAFSKRMYRYSRDAQDRLGDLQNKVQENLSGVMTVRTYQREQAEREFFRVLNETYVHVNLKLAKLRGVLFPLMGLFGAFGTIVLLYMGGQRIMDGRMSIGDFVEFNAYIAALTWPTIALGWMLSLWQRGLASMDRINDIFAESPTIQDGSAQIDALRGALSVRDLSFRYPTAAADATPALRSIETEFKAGETVVIVGRTGSGKSTLLKALVRLIEIPKDHVYLDGVDITELSLSQLRGAIAYAPQDAFLFSRTIHENIAFGLPEATDDQVLAAAQSAGLGPDLDGFPAGVDTIVGERGVTLSGGQRQRTALARALMLDSRILILDDTLAAVDTETEQRILSELARHAEGRTTILVTHRLACAQLADRILVMDEGRIAEQGTEEELLALGGLYSQMHARQRLREAIETSPRELGRTGTDDVEGES